MSQNGQKQSLTNGWFPVGLGLHVSFGRTASMSAAFLFNAVLESALSEVEASGLPVFTFAMYHDHESGAVSVCADSEDSSARCVASMNAYNAKHFGAAIAQGDLKHAALWQANVGRSLSLGDFAIVNAARTDIGDVPVDDRFYILMAQAVVAMQDRVAALAPRPDKLVFACSGAAEEVALVWAMPAVA